MSATQKQRKNKKNVPKVSSFPNTTQLSDAQREKTLLQRNIAHQIVLTATAAAAAGQRRGVRCQWREVASGRRRRARYGGVGGRRLLLVLRHAPERAALLHWLYSRGHGGV
jgi:hypothetical protein